MIAFYFNKATRSFSIYLSENAAFLGFTTFLCFFNSMINGFAFCMAYRSIF